MINIKCKKCGKEYVFEVVGSVYPGAKELETANCPYCGEVGYSKMTSQSIYSYELDENGNVNKNKVHLERNYDG